MGEGGEAKLIILPKAQMNSWCTVHLIQLHTLPVDLGVCARVRVCAYDDAASHFKSRKTDVEE